MTTFRRAMNRVVALFSWLSSFRCPNCKRTKSEDQSQPPRKSADLENGQNDQPASIRRSKSQEKFQILEPEESGKKVPVPLSYDKLAQILERESEEMQMHTEELSEAKSLPHEPSTSTDVETVLSENAEGKLTYPKMKELGSSDSPSQQEDLGSSDSPPQQEELRSADSPPQQEELRSSDSPLQQEESVSSDSPPQQEKPRSSDSPPQQEELGTSDSPPQREELGSYDPQPQQEDFHNLQIPAKKDSTFKTGVDNVALEMAQNVMKAENDTAPEPLEQITVDAVCELEICIDDVASKMVENVLEEETLKAPEPLKQNQPEHEAADEVGLDDVTMNFDEDLDQRSDLTAVDFMRMTQESSLPKMSSSLEMLVRCGPRMDSDVECGPRAQKFAHPWIKTIQPLKLQGLPCDLHQHQHQ